MIRTTAELDKLAKGVDAKFLEVFVENEDQYISTLSLLFRDRPSTQKREHTKLIGGTGELTRKTEGDSVSRTDLALSYETEYIHDTYAKGVSVTMEDIQDRDYADKLDEFGHLRRTADVSMDKAMAQVFNGAFATTTVVNGYKLSMLNDGVPLCSTVHPIQTGTTVSNASSTGVVLGQSGLKTAKKALRQQVADDGTPLALMGKMMLVVPPELEEKALQLTGSVKTPEDANNSINVYRGEIDVMVVTWLAEDFGGSDTAWFLVVQGQNRLTFLPRLAPSFDMVIDGNTKGRSYDVLARWSVGYSDWRFVWGSKGDAAAYSS